MTKREYDLLLSVRNGSVRDWRELGREDIGLLGSMKRQGFVFMDFSGRVTIDPGGYEALSAYEEQLRRLGEQAKEKANQDAQKKAWRLADVRRSWFQFFLGLLLGWVLGGFTAQDVFEKCAQVMKLLVH